MNYSEIIEYLYSRLPMFHRIGAAAYKADLSNTHAMMDLLGHPHREFKSVHVAGTNGKGSVSHMLAAAFTASGYKTGLYTSPHLIDFRERIKVNGEMIPESKVIEFVEQFRDAMEPIGLSFFEWTVGLAFRYFAEEKVDIAIIETGLGGRLDSTNVITPELSVITNISYDHMSLLGDTLEKIASEKAGIIKEKVPVVIGERQAETGEVFAAFTSRNHSRCTFASDVYRAESIRTAGDHSLVSISKHNSDYTFDVQLDLTGNYQLKNICTVLCAIEQLQSAGWVLPMEKVLEGLGQVKKLTGLMGRWQKISEKPLIICDVGHNESGIKYIVDQLNATPFRKCFFVIGMVSDKDVMKVLQLLPKQVNYFFTKADLPRSMHETELMNKAAEAGLSGSAFPSVKEALEAALKKADENDLIFIGGSTFVVGEALIFLRQLGYAIAG